MRTTWLSLLFFFAACGHHASANTSPSPAGQSITGRVVTTDRPDTLPPAPLADSGYAAWSARQDSLSMLVDTIIVLSPDSLVVHVGQAIEDLSLVQLESRRASGEPLRGIGHNLEIEDRSIAEHRAAGLTGVKVGRTRLVITVINRKAHAPPSYVSVTVLP